MTRGDKITPVIEEAKLKAKQLREELALFSDGVRCLLLINRTKDGGHNKESKRVFDFRVYYDADDFESQLKYMLLRKATTETPCRVYLSVNRRNLNKAARLLHQQLLDTLYDPQENKDFVYKGLFRNLRTYLMQPSARTETMFLIDVDNVEGREIYSEALRFLGENGIEIIETRPTKNGWHIVTKPFDPNLWPQHLGEIKKDALLFVE